MNCTDVRRVLPEVMDSAQDTEFQAHLKSCPHCSELVADLEWIASEARLLAEADEPPARVWVRIAAELKAEGLIHEAEVPRLRPVLVPQRRRWSAWWLVPVAAALLAAGSYVINRRAEQPVASNTVSKPETPQVAVATPPANQPASQPVPKPARKASSPQVVSDVPSIEADTLDDQQLMQEVSTRAPHMRASYENDLRSVNAYIRDAEAYLQQHPGDEEARQHLMDAYEQKAFLYQMALQQAQ